MKLNITPFHFEELIKKGYTLDMIYMLSLIDAEYDVSPLCEGSMKISGVYNSLIRRGLITENDKITTIGVGLLEYIKSDTKMKIIKRKPATEEFEEWWKVFPGTDTFSHKGKKFTGSRTLRQNRDGCRLAFDKILIEGEYSASILINALLYDVTQKKEMSVKTGNNKLSYMQNSLTYLTQRSYEPFIELMNEGVVIQESNNVQHGTDI
jgi:hypothetical protein